MLYGSLDHFLVKVPGRLTWRDNPCQASGLLQQSWRPDEPILPGEPENQALLLFSCLNHKLFELYRMQHVVDTKMIVKGISG